MEGDYLVLAFKNLKHRGIRSWLTLLGIVIGVTAVVSLISLGNGLQTAVASQFGVSSTEIITIQAGGLNSYGPPGSGAVNKLTIQDAEAIEKLSTVETTIPRNIGTVRFEYNNILQIGFIGSIPENRNRKLVYEFLDFSADKGRLLTESDNKMVVLGHNFQDKESNGFRKEINVGDSVLINNEKFRVVGFLEKKGSFIIDGIILMNEGPFKELTGIGNEVDIIAVKVKDKDLIDKSKEEIENLLRKRRNVKIGEEDFEVSTPEAMLETVNSVLSGVQIFIIIIASISIVVGVMGIVNTMTTSVLERKKEIGVMKSIGAKNSQIFMQFFIESGLLGFIGGVIGVLLGMLIGFIGIEGINNFLGSEIRMDLNMVLIAATLLGSFIIGAVAGIVPAMSAANQDPVEALRG